MDENPMSPTTGAGGFMVPSLPSPAPSTTSTIRSVSGLPHPRRNALRPGSAKEDKVRNFVSDRMMHISRRFAKKSDAGPPGIDGVQGYKSMGEVCKDLEGVINIVWLSGTPSLQVPYLLNIAGEFNTFVVAFPPSPTATFAILKKLDHCFASLLVGEDIESHEPLPGFENGLRSGMDITDMVRCKSIVEQARVLVVDVMNKEPVPEDEDGDEDEEQTGNEAESGPEGPGGFSKGIWDEDEERLYMDVARVYENTLVKLGERLGAGVEAIQISED
ncbi:hypothetical protein MFIFM68171_06682 [Madurella fahalii]|uniref:Meiotic recombination protein DMC1 n=1 Tax=Madurella fahalii TaxID=1157608 RepID=A0ABQ0GFD2_9PEZI